MKQVWRFGFLLSILVFLLAGTGCSKYEEVGLGTANVISKGATFRSEGGGVQEEVQFAGTWKTASFSTDYTANPINFTPRTITLENLPIVMSNMRNQQMSFTVSLTYMLYPPKTSTLFKNFKAYDHEIRSFFRESCLRVLSPVDLSLDLDIYSKGQKEKVQKDPSLSFESRDRIAKAIFDDFLRNFGSKYDEYMDCFWFVDAAVRNVDFPEDVLTKMEEAVAKVYEADALVYVDEIKDLEGKIEVAKASADLQAYGEESGALTPDVMSYLGNDLVDEFIKNPNIDVELWIPMEPDGTISWFR